VLSYARDRDTDAYETIPYWALVEAAVRGDIVSEDRLVERDSETGEVVRGLEAEEVDTYRALPPGSYNTVLMHVEQTYDIDTGRDPVENTETPTASEFGGVEDDPGQAAEDFLKMLEVSD